MKINTYSCCEFDNLTLINQEDDERKKGKSELGRCGTR